jgi:hypothetical protein
MKNRNRVLGASSRGQSPTMSEDIGDIVWDVYDLVCGSAGIQCET